MKKISCLMILLFMIFVNNTYADVIYDSDIITIESENEIINYKTDLKLKNNIKTKFYEIKSDSATIKLSIDKENRINAYRVALAVDDYFIMDYISRTHYANEDIYELSFESVGTYMIEVFDENLKTIEREIFYVGGYEKSIEADMKEPNAPIIIADTKFDESLTISNYKSHNLIASSDANFFKIDGSYNLDSQKYILYSIVKDGETKAYKKDVVTTNNKNEFAIKAFNKMSDGEYKFGVYTSDTRYSRYESFIYNINFSVENGQILFPISPVYEHNLKLYTDTQSNDPLLYQKQADMSEVESLELKELATSITLNKESDYEKLLAIHDWVASNIYYDYDALRSGDYGSSRAYDVYKTKKSVCAGYSNLTAELCKSINIPCKIVSGYALGFSSTKKWSQENVNTETNHAWNEAYVDERWVMLDTTWSSSNKFENKTFIKKNQVRDYFDSDLKYFSLSHKIIRYNN